MFKKGEENEQKNRLSPYITCKGTLYTKDMHVCVEILHMSEASRCCSWIQFCIQSKALFCQTENKFLSYTKMAFCA